ncbi:plant-specific GATA-type zinc finger transcription factor family protein [Actinidia rufa]|uniref:GATA transcription factor n=1 Tax=Actinidia rufa TaxID=165716 RepID=A0A7J0DE61_9ERIC|nr:plant-specific GATA-type zinc finger transcription factor family protein [Actinidia rufa]
MMGSDFMDEIDCGSFFDHIDDLIDFPADNGCGLGSGGCADFPSIWANPPAALPGSDPILSNNYSASDLSAELSIPYEDIVQLEWLSNFVEDSFSSGGMTLEKGNTSITKALSHNHFHTSSPVSVLESSSSSTSSSGGKKMLPVSPTQRGPHRARSKRPRPAAFNPRPAIQLASPTSSESENFAESHPVNKKKKMKVLLPLVRVEANPNPNPSQGVRKCMHCEITKTPQWRAGPMGPKTLCNACGVRYKSGRLFPEYRPAASPTFVPALHSNSHKKVLEMRTMTGDSTSAIANTAEPELIPNKNPFTGLHLMD